MASPPHVPTLRVPRADRSYTRSVTGSLLAHALLVLILVWPFGHHAQENRTPGDAGPLGGGGGGGAQTIAYVALPAYQAPSRPQHQQQHERLDQIVIPKPSFQPVNVQLPKLEMPKETRPQTAKVLGRGNGTGGGAGMGGGHGGGVGNGEGTGMGNATGPGTGGNGGNVFAPTPRFAVIPPTPIPGRLKGKHVWVHFWVSADGNVQRVEFNPRIGDAGYREKFLEAAQQYRFSPAITRDGTPVAGETTIEFTL